MSERPLEVGEIGILQNIIRENAFNGWFTEVVNHTPKSPDHFYSVKVVGFTPPKDISYGIWAGTCGAKLNQLRRITDPDQKQTIEREKEKVT